MSFYRDVVLADNPSALWAFEAGDSSDWTDEINNITFSVFGSPVLGAEGLFEGGKAVEFGGSSHLEAPWSGWATKPKAVELWLRRDTDTTHWQTMWIIVGAGNDSRSQLSWPEGTGSEDQRLISYKGGDLNDRALSNQVLSKDQSTHVVVQWEDGVGTVMYRDGVAQDTIATENVFSDPGWDTFVVGTGWYNGNANSNYWHGSASAIATYSDPLTQQQIDDHWAARTVPRSLSGTVEGETEGSTIAATVRAYREGTGQLVGEQALDGTESNFSINTEFDEPHTVVAEPPDNSGLQTLVFNNVTPIESGGL